MASFPITLSLKIQSYGLYPGADGNGELNINFQPGLTLILGANGLGKTTLITIIFRLMTGPFDLSLPNGSIGTTELKATSLNSDALREFAARVNDSAKTAKATLDFELGGKRFSVTRSLANLGLQTLSIDGEMQTRDEQTFQKTVAAAANLATFGEWILVLRTMVFFFEDRRALVWDVSAQRQLLRCLLLSPEQSSKWASAEREILTLDTRMRNLQSALKREEREIAETEIKTKSAPGVVAALKAAEAESLRLSEQQEQLADRLDVADRSRHRARLDLLRAESDYDSAIRELERARLSAIEARFPTTDESVRYILAHLMTNGECLVCKTKNREDKRTAFIRAIDKRICVVCDAQLPTVEPAVDIGDERIAALLSKVDTNAKAVRAAGQHLTESTTEYEKANQGLATCAVELVDIKDQITSFVNQLPPGEKAAREQHEEMRGLQHRVDDLRGQIKKARRKFYKDMAGHRDSIHRFARGIKKAFEDAAQGFLMEDSGLTWTTISEPVGQAGLDGAEPIAYPAFAVDLSGGDFAGLVRRDGPNQVSESQREFIDLAFRMALIKVSASNKAGTIVIDAPESSLDAVFVDRASKVLARFANDSKVNRLLATSNLAASPLIPSLMIAAEKNYTKRVARIVDLFTLGMPTRAMKDLAGEYDRYKKTLIKQITRKPK